MKGVLQTPKKGRPMQNTILIIGLTLITGLAVAYYLKARKSANELKGCEPAGERDTAETKEKGVKTAAL